MDNSASQGYSVWTRKAGKNTQDYVFLLSYTETEKFLKNKPALPTEYALHRGALTDKNHKTDGHPLSQWWLRSPGKETNWSIIIGPDGSVHNHYVDFQDCVVRPAVWVKQESIISSDKKSD